MIQSFNRAQVERLSASQDAAHVTLFLSASDESKDLRSLIETARQQLAEYWMSATDALTFLKPLTALQEDATFQATARDGAAIYLSADGCEVAAAAGIQESKAIVARRFCLRPMLLSENQFSDFYLLTISKQRLSLYRASLSEITQIHNAGLPVSFEEAVCSAAREPMLVHTGAEALQTSGQADFDDIDSASDPQLPALTEYLQQVDEAVCAYLHDRTGFLIVAGSEFETHLFKQQSVCSQRVGQLLTGNIDEYSPEKLLREAKPIALEQLKRDRETDAMEFRDRRRPVTLDAREILCAAQVGQVDTLFFDRDATLYGNFDRDRNVLQESGHPPQGRPWEECQDLIEAAMVQTILHGGRIHATPADDMPVRAKLAATLKC